MKLLMGLAEFFGLVTSQSEESEIDSYGVGAVMPYDISAMALTTLGLRDANAGE